MLSPSPTPLGIAWQQFAESLPKYLQPILHIGGQRLYTFEALENIKFVVALHLFCQVSFLFHQFWTH
jgi:hypothetical protein